MIKPPSQLPSRSPRPSSPKSGFLLITCRQKMSYASRRGNTLPPLLFPPPPFSIIFSPQKRRPFFPTRQDLPPSQLNSSFYADKCSHPFPFFHRPQHVLDKFSFALTSPQSPSFSQGQYSPQSFPIEEESFSPFLFSQGLEDYTGHQRHKSPFFPFCRSRAPPHSEKKIHF